MAYLKNRRDNPGSILIVYNTCGISKNERIENYVASIRSILSQKSEIDELVVSMCLNSDAAKKRLQDEFTKHHVSFNFVEEQVPVNVSFNHAVLEAVKRLGRFSGYLYLDSGLTLRSNTLNEFRARMATNEYGMIAAEASNDNGYEWWFGAGSLPGTGDFHMPIGKTINLHATVFTDPLYEAYCERLMPDVFASYSTESVFSFQCAAIKKKMVVCRGVIVDHSHAMDGGASGFRGPGFNTADHPFRSPRTFTEICADPEGTACGFGYDEFRPAPQLSKKHDPSQYDANLHCINDRLLPFFKNNMFLTRDRMDYDRLVAQFIDNSFTPPEVVVAEVIKEPEVKATTSDDVVCTNVVSCARCGENHDNLVFNKMGNPTFAGHTHFALCPVTGEPIMLWIEAAGTTVKESSLDNEAARKARRDAFGEATLILKKTAAEIADGHNMWSGRTTEQVLIKLGERFDILGAK